MVTFGMYGCDENFNYSNIHHTVTCNIYTGLGQVRNHEVLVLINHGFPFHTSVKQTCLKFKITRFPHVLYVQLVWTGSVGSDA
jgi:hypothetical protein